MRSDSRVHTCGVCGEAAAAFLRQDGMKPVSMVGRRQRGEAGYRPVPRRTARNSRAAFARAEQAGEAAVSKGTLQQVQEFLAYGQAA